MRRSKQNQKTGSPFDVMINEHLSVIVAGVERRLTASESLQQSIFNDAMLLKPAAIKMVLKWIAERDAIRAVIPRPKIQILIKTKNPMDVDNAILLLDIATKDSNRNRESGKPYLQLEPWAADTAQLRRRNATPEELSFLTETTRQVEESWTEGDW